MIKKNYDHKTKLFLAANFVNSFH